MTSLDDHAAKTGRVNGYVDDSPEAAIGLQSLADEEVATSDTATTRTAVVVPIRSFDGALSRLSSVLDAAQREHLMRLMAQLVIDSAHPMPIYVASDDEAVACWAGRAGAGVLRAGHPGLTFAVTSAIKALASQGVERVVVAHADLARARSLQTAVGRGLTIVPDRYCDGSNVVCVPTNSGFRFAYGPGSFKRHLREAQRLGLEVTVVDDPDLAADIDSPGDLELLPQSLRTALGLDPVAIHR